jgi:hypothetical protein
MCSTKTVLRIKAATESGRHFALFCNQPSENPVSRDVIVAVISSVVTALIGYVAANSLGLFEKRLTDTQLTQLGISLVDNQVTRDTLIAKMSESGKFQGPKGSEGPEGPKGTKGDSGPKWTPRFGEEVVAPTQSPQTVSLGAKAYCSLSRTGTNHANQACSCFLQTDGKNWTLRSSWDTRVTGTTCVCGARCSD